MSSSYLERWKSLFRVRFSDEDVRFATLAVGAITFLGMPIELLILRSIPDVVPHWPIYLSTASGAAIFGFALLAKSPRAFKAMPWLFVLNVALVALALYYIHPPIGPSGERWFPFQAQKLGLLIMAILAPGAFTGIAGITLHTGSALLRYYALPAAMRAQLVEEPWATLIFTLTALLMLANRLRIRDLQLKLLDEHARAESKRRLARTFLELRDLMNTPLQAVEIAATLLKKNAGDHETIVEQLHSSCERLRSINDLLKKYEKSQDSEFFVEQPRGSSFT